MGSSVAQLEAKSGVGFAKYYAEYDAHELTKERLARVDAVLIKLAVLVVQRDPRALASARLVLERRPPHVVNVIAYRTRRSRQAGRRQDG